jgi:hypothetical protein
MMEVTPDTRENRVYKIVTVTQHKAKNGRTYTGTLEFHNPFHNRPNIRQFWNCQRARLASAGGNAGIKATLALALEARALLEQQ